MNKNYIFSFFFIGVSLLFVSCDDTKLAQQLEGAWTGGYNMSYDDGSKERVTETLLFSYNENSDDDNGTFTELLEGKMHIDDTDGSMTCKYHSRIEGRYEVLAGDLYLYYNMSTLAVDVDENDIDISFDHALDQLEYEAASVEYITSTLRSPKEEMAKEAKKEIYRTLFHQYKQTDEDVGFLDLKVSDTEMSFDTEDMGRFTFHRKSTPKSQDSSDSVSKSNHKKGTDMSGVAGSPVVLTVQNVEYWDNLKAQGGNTYVPANMLDGNPSTAWAVNLDRASYDSDKLYGPTFTVRCKKLSHIIIRNGYAKDETSFRNNSRASRIIFCNADNVSDENESASYLYEGIVKDTPEPQTLKVNGNANSDIHEIQMIFPIDGLRRGAKWNDLCISEVEFWGWE